jgi:hypothetical protein
VDQAGETEAFWRGLTGKGGQRLWEKLFERDYLPLPKLLCGSGKAGVVVGLCSGDAGSPVWAGLWGTLWLLVVPFPVPPHPWIPARERNKKGDPDPVHLRRMRRHPNAPAPTLHGSRNSARFVYKTCVPLYIYVT